MDKNNGIFGAVTRREMNLIATVGYFTKMNQPQKVAQTDTSGGVLFVSCICYTLTTKSLGTSQQRMISIDIAKFAGEVGNTNELRQFAVFHWGD